MTHSHNFNRLKKPILTITISNIFMIFTMDIVIITVSFAIQSQFIIKLYIIIKWVKVQKDLKLKLQLKCILKLKKSLKKHLKLELQLMVMFCCKFCNTMSSWLNLLKISVFNASKDLWNRVKSKKSDKDSYFVKKESPFHMWLYCLTEN